MAQEICQKHHCDHFCLKWRTFEWLCCDFVKTWGSEMLRIIYTRKPGYHLSEWMNVGMLSRVQLFANLWTVAHQAPLSIGFSRQEYWSRLPFPSPGDLSDPGIEPTSPAAPTSQVNSLPSEPPGGAKIPPSHLPTLALLLSCLPAAHFLPDFSVLESARL